MNLVMTCTPIDRTEQQFSTDLQYAFCAARAFLSLYPEGNVYLGTTPDAKIPAHLSKLWIPLFFDFKKNPFALSRQLFYRSFCLTNLFSKDTLFTGLDVLFARRLPQFEQKFAVAMTYRYHPSQPYCSDFVLTKPDKSEFVIKFFSEIIEKMAWMPRQIQDGAADQLAYALQLGMLPKGRFNGMVHRAPSDEAILLLPGDDFLFTPNDFFSSNSLEPLGKERSDFHNESDFEALINHKYLVHFKGNRKHLILPFSNKLFAGTNSERESIALS